ncbi:MAG: metallophosphoesterase family protein [Nitrososphaeria archaeon]
MEIAFIADIHSNLEALEAVLDHLKGTMIFCLGDLVGYGADPNEVIELVRYNGIRCIMGNHDYAVQSGDVSDLNPRAISAVKWTRKAITKENLDFLSSLPRLLRFRKEDRRLLLAHATPEDPIFGDYIHPETDPFKFLTYATEYEEEVIGLGHLHVPYVYTKLDKVIFNPGSVGQPRDGNPLARFCKVDLSTLGVKIFETDYDRERSARKIVQAGLSTVFATRLFKGI